MTLNEFIEKYNGKYIDFDGWYGSQCLDLEHQYCLEVLGLSDPKILAAPSAKDVYNNFDTIVGKDQFERIPNTPTGIPKEGDIIFWSNGIYGHVAIFIEGNANSFRSFDQNYPTGTPCHVQNHTYSNCLGWLRFKGGMMQIDKKTFENLVTKSTLTDKICEKLNVEINESVVLPEIDKLLKYEDTIIQKDRQLTEAQETIAKLQTVAENKESELKSIKERVDELTTMVNDAITENKSLQRQLSALQQQAQAPIAEGWRKTIYDFIMKWIVRR